MQEKKILCKWPIQYLQDELFGICTGDLVVIACDSGCGKSTISRLIARSAREEDCNTCLYSLENKPGTFADEEIQMAYQDDTGDYTSLREFQIFSTKIPAKYKKYCEIAARRAAKRASDGSLCLKVQEQAVRGDYNANTLIQTLRHDIEAGYKLFIIDHLDAIDVQNEYSAALQIMSELWALVCEKNIAVVAFSQIVKSNNPPLCPSYDDLRGSKAKTFKATAVITLAKHGYGYYLPPFKYPQAQPTYINIAKARDVRTSCAVCFFFAGGYLDTYQKVSYEASGRFIDGLTREKLQKFKEKQESQK